MAGRSQDLINTLLEAESEADRIIESAREQRVKKLREARVAAEKELETFRAREDEKFQREAAAMEVSAEDSKALQATTKQELNMVQQDYKNNKEKAMQRIINNVISIDFTLSDNSKTFIRLTQQ